MKKILFLSIISLSVLMFSCKKEGCTDSAATNFNEEANEDDGTCTYESKTSFWFNQNISNWLAITYGVTNLNVYINDVLVGTMDPTDWKTGPDCGGANFTATLDMGISSQKNFTYSVRDQTGYEQFGGSYSNTANNCYSIELKW